MEYQLGTTKSTDGVSDGRYFFKGKRRFTWFLQKNIVNIYLKNIDPAVPDIRNLGLIILRQL